VFGEYGGYGPSGQMRDFVFIDDVVARQFVVWTIQSNQVFSIWVPARRSLFLTTVAIAVGQRH
jgi:nucleoside-diphosphate-sugar epimerase